MSEDGRLKYRRNKKEIEEVSYYGEETIKKAISMKKEEYFQQMLHKQLSIYIQKNEFGPLPHTVYKIDPK